jgi:hypothetical protein
VVRGAEIITANDVAVHQARRMAAQRSDITIFNYPVWARDPTSRCTPHGLRSGRCCCSLTSTRPTRAWSACLLPAGAWTSWAGT